MHVIKPLPTHEQRVFDKIWGPWEKAFIQCREDWDDVCHTSTPVPQAGEHSEAVSSLFNRVWRFMDL